MTAVIASMFDVKKNLEFFKEDIRFTYGVIRENESVLAFGLKDPTGVKTRVGSIALQEPGSDYEFLVLSMDNTHEFRAKNLGELESFMFTLYGVLGTPGAWEHAEDHIRGYGASKNH